MGHYCGIDLGKSTSHVCVIDDEQTMLYDRKLANEPQAIDAALAPFRRGLRMVVESPATRYWLVDRLRAWAINETLAHTLALQAFARVKVKADHRDARTLARLLRSDMIPPAYIYMQERRPLRDAALRRWRLVQMRADELSAPGRAAALEVPHGTRRA